MGCPMMRSYGHGMGGGEDAYVQTWRGDSGRYVMFHMWPMMLIAWMIFILGVMVGSKKAAMSEGMGGGMGMMGGPCGQGGGMGYGKMAWKHKMMGGGGRMMHHHHHGMGEPCTCEKGEGGEEEKPEGQGA